MPFSIHNQAVNVVGQSNMIDMNTQWSLSHTIHCCWTYSIPPFLELGRQMIMKNCVPEMLGWALNFAVFRLVNLLPYSVKEDH